MEIGLFLGKWKLFRSDLKNGALRSSFGFWSLSDRNWDRVGLVPLFFSRDRKDRSVFLHKNPSNEGFFITSIFLRWFFAAGIEFLRWKDLHWLVLEIVFEPSFDEQVLLYSLVHYFAHVGGLFQFQSWSVLHQRRRQGLLCISESWCFRGKLGLIRLQFLVRYQFQCSLLRWSRFSFLVYFLM